MVVCCWGSSGSEVSVDDLETASLRTLRDQAWDVIYGEFGDTWKKDLVPSSKHVFRHGLALPTPGTILSS